MKLRLKYIALCCFTLIICSCAAPRYASYTPVGSTGPAWNIQAQKTMTGWVTITINGDQVIKGQYPAFSEGRYIGEYKGKKIIMILSYHEDAWECLLYIDSKKIGDFIWHQ